MAPPTSTDTNTTTTPAPRPRIYPRTIQWLNPAPHQDRDTTLPDLCKSYNQIASHVNSFDGVMTMSAFEKLLREAEMAIGRLDDFFSFWNIGEDEWDQYDRYAKPHEEPKKLIPDAKQVAWEVTRAMKEARELILKVKMGNVALRGGRYEYLPKDLQEVEGRTERAWWFIVRPKDPKEGGEE